MEEKSSDTQATGLGMPEDAAKLLEQVADTVAAGQPLTGDVGAEFRRALDDLADRMENAVRSLRQIVELIHPAAQVKDLHLTPREMEVLSSLAEGLSNAEIATRCWISENTVKFHLKNLFRKMEVRDRGQAIMMARLIRRQLVPSEAR
jgi:LuxR family transcriptional regulator, maltose regulon positive regulatory protein